MKLKMITLDVDGCLVSYKDIGSRFESSWDALACAFNLKEKWDIITEEFYGKRDMDFEWTRREVKDLENLSVSTAKDFLYPLPYSKGAREFSEASRGKLIRGLLTSSIDLVAEKAASELGLDFSICNKLHRKNGFFTGTFDYNVPTWKKHERIKGLCERYSIKKEEICHVGDHENDISVADRVGMFIAFNPKIESVARRADYVISDFAELIKILNL
ncbi:MAG: haloacid dehalogenase-like hydrolase [archaeon]